MVRLAGVSSHAPKSCGFDTQAGHISGFQVQFSVGHVREATDGWFSLTSVFLSLSLLFLKSIHVSLGEG